MHLPSPHRVQTRSGGSSSPIDLMSIVGWPGCVRDPRVVGYQMSWQ